MKRTDMTRDTAERLVARAIVDAGVTPAPDSPGAAILERLGITPAKLFVTIPGRPPTPNNGPRNNWAAAAAERKQWRADAHRIALDIVNRARWQRADLVRVHVVFVVPTHGRRDWSNLIASLKPLEDGLVDAGVMADDSLDVIQSYTFGHRYERGIAATEFHVERVDVPGLGL